jgi:hypothetical protein
MSGKGRRDRGRAEVEVDAEGGKEDKAKEEEKGARMV